MWSIFKKNSSKKVEKTFLKLDMHSHLLPGIDDGSSNMEESIFLISKFVELGYEKIITTPHIMGDFFKNTPEIIHQKLNEVKTELDKRNINIQIEAAAEYYLDDVFYEKVKNDEKLLTFGNNHILIETSYMSKPQGFREMIFELQVRGYNIILAHPERYTYMYGNFEEYREIYETNIQFQINMNSMVGYYSPMAQKAADFLIHNQMVDFVASDCHKEKHIEVMKEAMNSKLFKKLDPERIFNNSLL